MKKPKNHLVHSVKRISDGEIFTVGDKININRTQPTIFKIEIDGEYCWLHYLSIAEPNVEYYKSKAGGVNYTSEIKDASRARYQTENAQI